MLSGVEDATARCLIVIPAYKPQRELIELIAGLIKASVRNIVVVNDGSGPEFEELFRSISGQQGVSVVRHAINLGKGAALKTGFNHALCICPDLVGVVTADADGQHSVADIVGVRDALIRQPDALVLGRRSFGRDVPLRSRFGNLLTRGAVRLLVGKPISDTQTGLRGIPAPFLARLMHLNSTGYEFELDMLIAAKHHGRRIAELPIQTIYLEDNKSSHFNPLLDSMRIYFALLRFSGVSLITAVIDNLTFLLAYQATANVALSQVLGRAAAVTFNYTAARRAVFHSRRKHAETLPSYLLLVVASGFASYSLITLFERSFRWNIVAAKLVAESLLFLVNFLIQRDWVFTGRENTSEATDWDAYYKNVAPTAKLTRRYTGGVLRRLIEQFGGKGKTLVELGGANSCFLDEIRSAVNPAVYHVIDNNQYGLDLLAERLPSDGVKLHQGDVLALSTELSSDLVFSVGLIEHFDPQGTKEAVRAHFQLVKPGGIVIFTFPTPTHLYRTTRASLERLHLWKFPDERPLEREEVNTAAHEFGTLLHEEMLWPLMLTQRAMVFRKN